MLKSRTHGDFIKSFTYDRRILLLLLVFGISLIFGSYIVAAIVGDVSIAGREDLLLTSAVQNLVMWILPAVVVAIFLSKRPISFLGLNRIAGWRSVAGILILYIVGMPVLNQIIYWNEHISFPSWLSELESVMRQMEDSALSTTEILLNSTSIGGLMISLLIVGLLTGFSEEIFFRGALQKIVGSNGMNPHLAIWISAFIFSLLHFQFFGFLPRMLLGAFFGYIYLWTGSIWMTALAHAINNSIVVVTSYLTNIGYNLSEIENVGVVEQGVPIVAIISLVLVVLFFVLFRTTFFPTKRI